MCLITDGLIEAQEAKLSNDKTCIYECVLTLKKLSSILGSHIFLEEPLPEDKDIELSHWLAPIFGNRVKRHICHLKNS